MRSKLQHFGYVLLISGTVLFGIMHLAIALYIPSLRGWGNPPGKLATVLNEINGWIPYILSIVFMVVGVCFSIYSFIDKSVQKQMEEMKDKDRQWHQKVSNEMKDKEQ